ncbi:uncharacterized protein LOC122387959 [Amphibalanus amphitrite]|uniref:uncharacterized protein LOC122387959 n=1 Tax=Amphibalanus amphitrite TaxID=1232801 RepID=UPI001C91F6E4|nr:uncharacterized protein LOC122387959 [Amphibalanus amphitrite]
MRVDSQRFFAVFIQFELQIGLSKDPLEFPAHDLKLLPQDLQLRTAVALGAEQNTTQKDVVKVDVKRPCSDAVRADLAAGDGSERGRGVWMDLERDSIDQTIQITQEPYKGGPGFAAYLSPPAGTPSPASGNQPSTSPGTACTASSPTGGFSPHTAGLSPQTPAGGADRAGLDWLTTDIELISAVQKANGSPNQMKFWLSVQRDIAGKPRNQRQRRSLMKKADALRRKFANNKQFSSWRARTPWCLCRHVPARNRR